MFPEVLTVDTTCGINNEAHPLLTISGKDSNGLMFTVGISMGLQRDFA